MKSSTKTVCRIAIAVVGLYMGLNAFVGTGSVSDNSVRTAAAAEVPPAYSADAIYYTTQFKTNEVAANMKFGDAPVKVRGKITNIRLDFSNNAIVELDDGTFSGFQVKLRDSQKNIVSNLNKGDSFAAVGNHMQMLAGMMYLNDGVVVNN